MLPRLDGLSVIEKLRQREIRTPVIILSAKRSVDDRIKGLQKAVTTISPNRFLLPSCWRGYTR
jgi:DNA-binding response OmpR family regulator